MQLLLCVMSFCDFMMTSFLTYDGDEIIQALG